MPRNRKERSGFNPWLNRERLRGTKQHKPLLAFRKPTLERIAENHDALIQETPMDIFDEQDEYVIRLSPLAYPLTQLFAEREILAEQYTNWENAHIGGVLFPGDNDTVADSEMQEIAFELMNLVKLVRMDIGGGCVLDDGTAYPTALELITVGMAHSRGLVGIDPLAPDDWIFIIVHVLPSEALSDSNYGVDIAHDTDFHGSLKVFGGKVVRDVPALDLEVTYGDEILSVLNTRNASVEGDWITTRLALPAIIGGSSESPCNGCLPYDQSPQPPTTPPTPPTPPTTPTSPDPVNFPPPTPNKPITTDTVCSSIFFDEGVSFGANFHDESLNFRKYGNILLRQIYPAHIAGAIHDWIVANTSFDFSCDTLVSISFQLRVSVSDKLLFSFIPFPVPFTNTTPRLQSLEADGITFENVYYFQPDRQTTQQVIPPAVFPTYTELWYEQPHTYTIRPKDRFNGDVGFEKLTFYLEAVELIKDESIARLDLDVCAITAIEHQYLFSFNLDGSDEIRIIAGQTYIYDTYKNARIPIDTGSFITDGIHIDTDGEHGFTFLVDMICPMDVNATDVVVYGKIKAGTPVHNFDTEFGGAYRYGGSESGFGHSAPLLHDMPETAFQFENVVSFTAGNQADIGIRSGIFPDAHFILTKIAGYLA